jgi:integrase
VLGDASGCLATIPYARPAFREADTLTADEAGRLLAAVAPAHRVAVALLHGAGLRLMECLSLRVKDVDFARDRIHVRDGKGGKGRFTMLPAALRDALSAQVDHVRRRHARDVQAGGGYVVLPYGFGRKSPSAIRDWRWAWVFPSTRQYREPVTGTAPAASRVRHDDSAGGRDGGAAGAFVEARDAAHVAAFVRDAVVAAGI